MEDVCICIVYSVIVCFVGFVLDFGISGRTFALDVVINIVEIKLVMKIGGNELEIFLSVMCFIMNVIECMRMWVKKLNKMLRDLKIACLIYWSIYSVRLSNKLFLLWMCLGKWLSVGKFWNGFMCMCIMNLLMIRVRKSFLSIFKVIWSVVSSFCFVWLN